MRRLTRDDTEYRNAIVEELWHEIQSQFQPYNPAGKKAAEFDFVVRFAPNAFRLYLSFILWLIDINIKIKEYDAKNRLQFGWG